MNKGSPWEGLTLKNLGRTPHWGKGRTVLHEEEGAAKKPCDELSITPIPHLPRLMMERSQRTGNKIRPRKEGNRGSKVF